MGVRARSECGRFGEDNRHCHSPWGSGGDRDYGESRDNAKPAITRCRAGRNGRIGSAGTANVRVGERDRAEGLLEGFEPRFIVAPMVHPLAVDGLADLLGAGGPDGTLVLEESQALRLEGSPQ